MRFAENVYIMSLAMCLKNTRQLIILPKEKTAIVKRYFPEDMSEKESLADMYLEESVIAFSLKG